MPRSDKPVVIPAVPPPLPPLERSALDRRALERVLARAAELHSAAPDSPELLSEEQILELGREVGLSPAALRQALAEERSRVVVPSEVGYTARLFGARVASASRTVRGHPSVLLERLNKWMVQGESLSPKRRFPDRVTWEPRRGFWAKAGRAMDFGGRGYALAHAVEVGATAIPIDAQRSLVQLDADLSTSRVARVQMSGLSAASGVGTGGAAAIVAAVLLPPTAVAVAIVATAALVPAAIGAGAAYAIARQHGSVLARAQLALEQLLDRLEG